MNILNYLLWIAGAFVGYAVMKMITFIYKETKKEEVKKKWEK